MTERPTPERIQQLRRLHEMRDGIFPPQCWCGIDWPCPVAEVLAALDGAEERHPANCERCGKTAEFIQVCAECHWTEMQKVEALERRLGEARRGLETAKVENARLVRGADGDIGLYVWGPGLPGKRKYAVLAASQDGGASVWIPADVGYPVLLEPSAAAGLHEALGSMLNWSAAALKDSQEEG